MDGSSRVVRLSTIDVAGPDIIFIGRSGLFGLDDDIAKPGISVLDYEEKWWKNNANQIMVWEENLLVRRYMSLQSVNAIRFLGVDAVTNLILVAGIVMGAPMAYGCYKTP